MIEMLGGPNEQTNFVLTWLKKLKPKTVLNVGFRNSSSTIIPKFCRTIGAEFEILEIYEPNCRKMQSQYKVTCHDFLKVKELNRKWDMILWLHGPEHVRWNDYCDRRRDMEAAASQMLLLQAPLGHFKNEETYGNPYEEHKESLFPCMFRAVGYRTALHVKSGERTFSAWKLAGNAKQYGALGDSAEPCPGLKFGCGQ